AMHPNGQIPAYEWNFDDVNPPVQAWAAMRVYEADRAAAGAGDRGFLERTFQKLLLTFTWWVNREDAGGRDIFQGGFLGLDNVGPFDLRKPLPGGERLDQADGTAWAGAFALHMMRIAVELACENHVYEDMAIKFFEHFLGIARAIHGSAAEGDMGLWDEPDLFYFDKLAVDGRPPTTIRVFSAVGLVPLFATEAIDDAQIARLPRFRARMEWFEANRPDLARLVSDWRTPNGSGLRLLALLRRRRLSAILSRVFDEAQFLSSHGVRSVSKWHREHPFAIDLDGMKSVVKYEPGDGETRIYGGNSNWRGPVWAPVNYLLVESLRTFDRYWGADFDVEAPTGSGRMMHLGDAADELARRFAGLFLKDAAGRRPFLGEGRFADDPAFRDLPLFHEFFHGDTGKGLGASHQTGWTALVALLLAPRN
ncbi:MAG: glucosidase, partial [Hyphomicrobiales bacterium]|nr:glucosidase [Hyphomicrobiales bacterium]